MVKVLLLSAYAAGSHVYWQQALQDLFDDWDWQVLSLPARHFSWRVRGNPLYWSRAERDVLEQDYDLLVATSMVDLATLRGLVPSLVGVPSLLYFHENQFDYPQDKQRHSLLEAQMVSIYSAMAADSIAFNSAYNRDTFLGGCTDLLARLPDYVPEGIVDDFAAKSQVLPVPVCIPEQISTQCPVWRSRSEEVVAPLRLLWVGRLEHDKGGDMLLGTLRELQHLAMDFEVAVVGQQFRTVPEAFRQIQAEFSSQLVHLGYLPTRAEYFSVLGNADIVLSTARHEFQGLAVMEAVVSGCLPVLPDRLAYPEFFPETYLYRCNQAEPKEEAAAAARLIASLAAELAAGPVASPQLPAVSIARLRPHYADALGALASVKDSVKDSHCC